MIVSLIKNYFKRNKKFLFSLFLFFWIFFILSDFAFAADTATSTAIAPTNATSVTTPNAKATSNEWYKTAEWLKVIFVISATLIGVLTSLVSLLLYPGWTSGNVIGLDLYMKDIWILVSNVVYFIFAFILIYIAVMNIVWQGGKDKYQLKSALPRFIIWILIVPFSWFAVQFILSISAFLSVASLSLPYSTFQGMPTFTNGIKDQKICNDYKLYLGWKWDTPTWDSGWKYDIWKTLICNTSIPIKDVIDGKDQKSLYGIIYLYTYSILDVGVLDEFNIAAIDSFVTFLDAIQKVLFDMIFIVVYSILMFALFLALFVRGMMFWIYAMLSPVMGLAYFMGKGKSGGGGITEHFNITQIIHLAFVPVYVCLALSFGYLFLLVAWQWMNNSNNEINSIIKEWRYTFAWFSLDINGAFWATPVAQDKNKVTASNFGWIIWKIIIELFGIAILWVAIMAALKMAKITEGVTKSIADLWNNTWKTLAKLPSITPIPFTWLSASGLSHVSSRISSRVDEIGREWAEKYIGENPFLDQYLNKTDPELLEAIKSVRTSQKNEDISKNIWDLLSKTGIDGFTRSKQAKEVVADKLEILGVDKKIITDLRDPTKTDSQDEVREILTSIHNDLIKQNKQQFVFLGDTWPKAKPITDKSQIDTLIWQKKEEKKSPEPKAEEPKAKDPKPASPTPPPAP